MDRNGEKIEESINISRSVPKRFCETEIWHLLRHFMIRVTVFNI
jgi:hypothetical protein